MSESTLAAWWVSSSTREVSSRAYSSGHRCSVWSMSRRCSAAAASRSRGGHPEAATAATSDGQAGSAMTVSAMREPSRWCSSVVHGGRSAVSARCRVGGARVPASRHHSAAAGSSSGSAPWRVNASVSRWATSAPARAAWSRWLASCGQNGSVVMCGSMLAARVCQRCALVSPRRRAVSMRVWMSSCTAAERVACCGGPVMRVSAASTWWAARNTAISAVSSGCLASSGRAHGGAVAGRQWRALRRICSASSAASRARACR